MKILYIRQAFYLKKRLINDGRIQKVEKVKQSIKMKSTEDLKYRKILPNWAYKITIRYVKVFKYDYKWKLFSYLMLNLY